MAKRVKIISTGQMLGIGSACAVIGIAGVLLYYVHPLLLAAGILLAALILALVIRRKKGKKGSPALLAVLSVGFIAALGLGLYFGLNDRALLFVNVMEDTRIQAAIEAGNSGGSEDGTLTAGTYIIVRRKDSSHEYSIRYRSESRLTRGMMDRLQTVVVVSDYETIDSGQYVLKQFGKQVGQSVTAYQYRVKLRYYDVEKGEVVRIEVVDGDPLTKDGGGGPIPDSVIVKAVKASMTEAVQ